jgi:cytochrome c oxidase subunit II
MAAESQNRPAPPPEPNHLRRFLTIWLGASVIAVPLEVVFLGPELPPGKLAKAAGEQVTDYTVLLAMATPALLLIVLYIFYAVVNFRAPRQQPGEPILEGPAVRGNTKLQVVWIVITTSLVLSLFGYGTVRLLEDNGSGSGSGPTPLTKPKGPKLRVQVIAQQWYFTYRWPQYGGVETPHLFLPAGKDVEFNVTSLDVIHSFWAYQLGVKADANPQVDNIAFSRPEKEGSFEIRCAELCGIWHGEMQDTGHVVSPATWETWINEQRTRFAAATAALPPFHLTYQPEPTRRGG